MAKLGDILDQGVGTSTNSNAGSTGSFSTSTSNNDADFQAGLQGYGGTSGYYNWDTFDNPQEEEPEGRGGLLGAVQGVGNFAGNFILGGLDSATFGLLGVMDDLVFSESHLIREVLSGFAYDEWDEETGSGKWGRGLGTAAGMLVPFSMVGKGLNVASRSLYTVANRGLWSSTTKAATKPFMAKYLEKEGSEQILSAVHKIGGLKGPVSGLSDDMLNQIRTTGYRNLMEDAYGIVKDPVYKKLIAKNNQVFSDGVQQLSQSILKQVPNVGKANAVKLSDDLLREALHHSNNSFHMATEKVAGFLLGGAKDSFRQQYMSKFLGAMVSDFMIGATMHTAEAAIQNAFYWSMHGMGAVDEQGNKIDKSSLKNLDPRSAAGDIIGHSFGDLMKRAGTHGLWFSLIGPTRFIKGGSNWQGKGKMHTELRAGANAIFKSWRNVKKMSGNEARTTLQIMDGAADGLLHVSFPRLTTTGIAQLSDAAAKQTVNDVRKKFMVDYAKWFGREMTSDLTGSAPRMIAGMLAMNAPNIYKHLKENPETNMWHAFGEDGSRIVENILVGMIFSKSGRSFNTGQKTKIFESGKLREYYAGNTNDIQQMRRGLEIMGMDVSKLALGQGSPSYEMSRGHVKNQPLIRDFHNLINEFYVDRVTHTPSNRKDVERAFEEHLVKELKLEPGSPQYELEKKRYTNFEAVLKAYDKYATDVNVMFRPVHAKEAFDLVQAVNSLTLIQQSKDLKVDIDNAVLSGWNRANNDYKDIKKAFVIEALEAVGLTAVPDPKTGNLTVPKIANLDRYYENQNSVSKTYGRNVLHQLDKVMKHGAEDGWLQFKSSAEIKQTYDGLVGLEQSFTRAKEAMLVHIYGPTNVKNGHYPGGGTHGDLMILSNAGMREASLGIDHAVQLNNVMSLFNIDRGAQSTYNTLPKDKIKRITQLFNQLGLDQNPIIAITDKADPGAHQASIDVFNKVVETYKLLNVKGGSNTVEVSLDQIESLRDNLRSTVGDAFEATGSNLYKEISNSAMSNFQNLLRIHNADASNSVTLALDHLIRGNRVLETKPQEMTKTGNFVLRTKDGLQLPDATILFDILKERAPDKVESIIKKEKLSEFYQSIQGSSQAAGDIIKFTKDMGSVERIVDAYGADKILELLTQAKVSSDIGGIKDLVKRTLPLETAAEELVKIRDKWTIVSGTDVVKQEAQFFNNLKELSKQTMGLSRAIKWAMSNYDYPVLTNIMQRQKNLDRYIGDLTKFINFNVNNAPHIDAAYKKQLATQLTDIRAFMNRDYGEINLENYGKYVEKEMKKHQFNTDGRVDETITNITSSQFEARYGMNAGKVSRMIKPFIDKYKDATTPGFIGPMQDKNPINYMNQAFDRLYERVNQSQDMLPEIKRRSKETRILDTFQTILQTVSMKEVNKVKWVDGKFVLSKDYMLNQYEHGPLALFNNLGIRDQFYTLDSNMKISDGKGGSKETPNPSPKEKLDFDTKIETELISLDVPQVKLHNLKGHLNVEHNQVSRMGKNYTSVDFGEGNIIVIPVDAARRAVAQSFDQGGYYRNKLEVLFPDAKDARYLQEMTKFGDINKLNDISVLKEGLLVARLITDMPTALIKQTSDVPSVADMWKRLKMPNMTKGRIYTPQVLDFTMQFYRGKELDVPYFKHVANAFDRFLDTHPDRQMKVVSIDDSMDNSVFKTKKRFEQFLYQDKHNDIFKTGERMQILAQHDKFKGDGLDAATFMTKDMFLIHMAQLGVRKEFVTLNDKGEIIGFQSGAIKPKGVSVEVNDNGGVQVWYDKTAIFYDASVAKMMDAKGVDVLAVKTGNKVNEYRENASADLKQRFVRSDRDKASETIYEDLEIVFNSHTDADIIKLPLSTFNVTNVSKKHNAKIGANMAVHLDHNVGIDTWMEMRNKVDEFNTFLMRSMNNEFAMTSLAQELMGRQKDSGDLMLSKVPVEHILNENGLIIDQWMGDVVADKLFTYFFQGSKIATADIGNSSIAPMAPPIHHRLNVHDFAVRTSETREVDGRSTQIKRQKIIGSHIPDAHSLDQAFSFIGKQANHGDGNRNTVADTGFFIKRMSYNIGKDKETADFVIIPSQAKKDGTTDWIIRGNGYELTANELINLNAVDRNNVSERLSANNKELYNQVIKDANKIWSDLSSLKAEIDADGGVLTNRQVVKYLSARPGEKYHLGELNNRQPRNTVNDVVINKITALSENTNVRDRIIAKDEVGEFKYDGYKSQQNLGDAKETQDNDYDYDKSSTYMSAPPSLVADVAKKAGYGMRNDSDSFAKTFFEHLNTKLTNDTSLKRHLSAFNNSAALRGRIVKLHQVSSYFMNAFKGDSGKRVIGTFMENGREMQIRMKSQPEYFLSVENIGDWAKIFIDNYSKPTKAMNIESLVKDILFGRDISGDGKRHYEGLFEIYDVAKDSRIPFIDNQHNEIRSLLYKRLVMPVSKYLRLNRGMTEVQEGQTSSLRLKDIANGWSTLNYELGNPHLYLDSTMPDGNRKWIANSGSRNIDFSIDLRPGMESLTNYITGGKDLGRPHPDVSNNPFDVAMRTLASTYNESFYNTGPKRNITDIESLLMKAEAGVLLQSEGMTSGYDKHTVSQALYEYVKNDYGYIEVSKLAYRIQTIDKDIKYLKSSKWADKNEIGVLENKKAELMDIKSDIELRIGAEFEYANGKQRTIGGMQHEIGNFKNTGKHLVFWHTEGPKAGNIVGVIKNGENNSFKITKSMVAIQGGRKFELAHPMKQKALYAQAMAFHSLPMDNIAGSADVNFITPADINIKIVPKYDYLRGEMNRLNNLAFPKGTRTPAIDMIDYSTQRKALINRTLNQLDSPLERKALIWRMLRPSVDNTTIAYRRDNEGKHINEMAYRPNSLSKPTWQLLLDIYNQEGFNALPGGHSGNVINKLEAYNLMKEIVGRQTLASLGLENPYIDVNLQYDFGTDYRGKYHRKLYTELNRDVLNAKVQEKGVVGELALTKLNEFMNGEVLMTPAEMYDLQKAFDLTDGRIFLTSETTADRLDMNGGRIPERPKRMFGMNKKESVTEFVDRFNSERKQQRLDNCKGK